jgi:glutaminyl-peptide cyclotransferase
LRQPRDFLELLPFKGGKRFRIFDSAIKKVRIMPHIIRIIKHTKCLPQTVITLLAFWLFCSGFTLPQPLWALEPLVYGYKIVHTFPHDPQAYTQGLFFHQGFLYEGTGLEGKSSLRKIDLKTGKILKLHRLPESWFGEGIAFWEDKLFQLTWQNRIGLIYEFSSFRLLKTFYYPTEGWGLTQDGRQLIMSDGTETLYFIDPKTLKENKKVRVLDRGSPVRLLNELEYIRGEIFANVYQTDWIARISPETGEVLGWIDLRGLLPEEDRKKGAEVLNGIAYDTKKGRLFVTGKFWPKLFEIRLVQFDRKIKPPIQN